jgi:hypothetical protein
MGIFLSKTIEELGDIQQERAAIPLQSMDLMSEFPKVDTYYRLRMSFVRHALSCANMYIKSLGYGKGVIGSSKGSTYGVNADLCLIGAQQSRQLGTFIHEILHPSIMSTNTIKETPILVVSELLRTQETMLISCLDILTPYLKSGKRVIVCPYLNEEQSIIPDIDFFEMKDRDNVPSSLPETIKRFQNFVLALFADNNVYNLKRDPIQYPYLFNEQGTLHENCWERIFDTEIFYGTGNKKKPFPFDPESTTMKKSTNLSNVYIQTKYKLPGKKLYDPKQLMQTIHIMTWTFMKRYGSPEEKTQFVKQIQQPNGKEDTLYLRYLFFGHHHTIQSIINQLLPDVKPFFKQYQILNAEYIDVNYRTSNKSIPIEFKINPQNKFVQKTLLMDALPSTIFQNIRRFPIRILMNEKGKITGSKPVGSRPILNPLIKSQSNTLANVREYPYIVYLPRSGLFIDQTKYTAAKMIIDGNPTKLSKPILRFLKMSISEYLKELSSYEHTLNGITTKIKMTSNHTKNIDTIDFKQWLMNLKQLKSSIQSYQEKYPKKTVLNYLSEQTKNQRKNMVEELLKDMVDLCALGSEFLADPVIRKKVAQLIEHGDLYQIRKSEYEEIKETYTYYDSLRESAKKNYDDLVKMIEREKPSPNRDQKRKELDDEYTKQFNEFNQAIEIIRQRMIQLDEQMKQNINTVKNNPSLKNQTKQLESLYQNVVAIQKRPNKRLLQNNIKHLLNQQKNLESAKQKYKQQIETSKNKNAVVRARQQLHQTLKNQKAVETALYKSREELNKRMK